MVDYFELSNEEIIACNDLIKIVKQEVLDKDKNVKAFNIGTNAGKIAGQSIMHCHIHLIPRRKGDVDNPQGGVRSVIPKKQHYNCLLYTSPSPRDLSTSRMPSSA